jgi:aryl-alcohol dehydrogenase-like predicted oxidoreductase
MNAPGDRTRKLGRTDLDVCRLGIGGGNALSAHDLEYAVSRGVNYLFTSTDLHAATYRNSWPAFDRLARSPVRKSLTIVACSYVNDPEKLLGVLMDQLLALRLDYVDVFQWGWVTKASDPHALLRDADSVMRGPMSRNIVSSMAGVARQVGSELQRRGYARYLAISTHDRSIARQLVDDERVDILMIRYNIAHRGAEAEIFPYADAAARPGIVAFNTAHDQNGMLSRPPADLPTGKFVPTVPHLYRYCLDHPMVDVVLSGPGTRAELDEGLLALDMPPLDERMVNYLRKYGDLHAGKVSVGNG